MLVCQQTKIECEFQLSVRSAKEMSIFKQVQDYQGQEVKGAWDPTLGHVLQVRDNNFDQPQFLVENGPIKQKVCISCQASRKFCMQLRLHQLEGMTQAGARVFTSKDCGVAIAKSSFYSSTEVDFEVELEAHGKYVLLSCGKAPKRSKKKKLRCEFSLKILSVEEVAVTVIDDQLG